MTGERPDVDAAALETVLEAEVGVDVAAIDVLADGLNLLLSVSTRGNDDAYVLRSPRKLRSASYMNDFRTEYAVLEALAASDVTVPEPVAFRADETTLGEPFYVVADREPYRERAASVDSIRWFELTPIDEDSFYVYVCQERRAEDAAWREAFAALDSLVVPPIR